MQKTYVGIDSPQRTITEIISHNRKKYPQTSLKQRLIFGSTVLVREPALSNFYEYEANYLHVRRSLH